MYAPIALRTETAKTSSARAARRIVRAGALFQRLHIALAGRESEEAALMIEQIFKLVGAELLIAHKVEEDARIEIAGARAHRNAAGGSEAHGGVDRYSVAKSAEAGSVAEMREDGSFGKLRAEMMHQRLVGETVETIASNPCVEIALRERQMRCHFRHGLVKSIVETGEVRRRRKDRLRGSDERQRLRDVQRREMCGGAELVQNLRGDELVRAEVRAAVHDAMSHSHRRGVNMLPDCRSKSGEGIALRFVNTSLSRPEVVPSEERMFNVPLLRPMPSALPVSRGSSSFAPRW